MKTTNQAQMQRGAGKDRGGTVGVGFRKTGWWIIATFYVAATFPAVSLRTDTLIVYNQDEVQSLRLAYRYAAFREIPASHLFGVSCPPGEVVSYEEFLDRIMQPLWQFIVRSGFVAGDPAGRTTSLADIVIVHGVPYRLSGARRSWTVQQLVSSWSNILKWYGDPPELPPSLTRTAINNRWAGAKWPASNANINEAWLGAGFDYDGWKANRSAEWPGWWITMHLMSPSYDVTNRMLDDIMEVETGRSWAGICYVDQRKAGDRTSQAWDQGLAETAAAFAPYGPVYMDGTMYLPNEHFMVRDALFAFDWYNANQSPGAVDAPSRMMAPGSLAWSVFSASASSMASPTSSWAAKFLADGACATVGAVAEPFLTNYPRSLPVVVLLRNGHSLGEALVNSVPYPGYCVSFFGDPLYKVDFSAVNGSGIWNAARDAFAAGASGRTGVLEESLALDDFRAAEVLEMHGAWFEVRNDTLIAYLRSKATDADEYRRKSAITKLWNLGCALDDSAMRQWAIARMKEDGFCFYANWYVCE